MSVRRDVSDVAPSVPDVGTQKPGYVSPLPVRYLKSIIAELGYTEDGVENAWSNNNGDFGKTVVWLLEHCVRDHSSSDEDGDMVIYGNSNAYAYGDGIDFDVDDSDSCAFALEAAMLSGLSFFILFGLGSWAARLTSKRVLVLQFSLVLIQSLAVQKQPVGGLVVLDRPAARTIGELLAI